MLDDNNLVSWQTCSFKRNPNSLLLVGLLGYYLQLCPTLSGKHLPVFVAKVREGSKYFPGYHRIDVIEVRLSLFFYQVFITPVLWYLSLGDMTRDSVSQTLVVKPLNLRILTLHGCLLFRSVGEIFICSYEKK